MDPKLILKRTHDIYKKRLPQLSLNFLAQAGGREYVEHALQRFPSESNISWSGDSRGVGGRVSRAVCISDAGRISSKITQYLFSRPTIRTGIDEDWAKNVTGSGVGINSFWATVSENLTAGQWTWLKADRDSVNSPRSLADRPNTDVVRWTCYPSTSVPDFCVDNNGQLQWLLTEEFEYNNEDPTVEAELRTVRYLWQMVNGKPQWKKIGEVDKEVRVIAEGSVSGDALPFVLLGKPSVQPWWYDSVADIQGLLLNLESCNVENIIRTVFPQLVISSETYNNLEVKLIERLGSNNGQAVVEMARELVRGLDTPLIETAEGKNITRYLMPDANNLSFIPSEIKRKRAELFDSVGMALFSRETRMVESAESKAFTQLDISSTLGNRAKILEEAEIKLVDASVAIDSAFKTYKPQWPTNFSVEDWESDAAVLKTLSETITPEQTAKFSQIVDKTLDRYYNSN